MRKSIPRPGKVRSRTAALIAKSIRRGWTEQKFREKFEKLLMRMYSGLA